MKGIKKHTHEERRQVLEEMPLIRRKFGANLVALAASASFARGEDADYSDLELTAFVKTMPAGVRRGGIGKIRDGLLVELEWMTREVYLADVREVTGAWYLAGSDTLLPLINPEFIAELNNYRVENLEAKCLAQAVKHWHEVQEATAKVLNAVAAQNREGLPLLLCDMLRHALIVLSFLNQTPYVTFAQFVTAAKRFPAQPTSFAALVEIVVRGAYQDLPRLEATAISVFTEFEQMFAARGLALYDDNVDPN
jgi:hypothetical protein